MITLEQQAHLTVLYTEPHRHYHNLNHVHHCLRELRGIPGLDREQFSILEAAIWFHDAVYDPRAEIGENERASIHLMYTANLKDVPVTVVEDLIAATVTHKIPEDESSSFERLLGLFLDIDLSVLGQPPEEYDKYSTGIAEEYSWVPFQTYRNTRRHVLVNFLARPHIYFTDHFRKKYETQARVNISNEAVALVPERPIKIHEE